MRIAPMLLPALAIGSMLFVGVGCASKTSSRHIRNNYTPELYSQVRNHEQYANDGHRTANHLVRTRRDDIQRFWLRDKNTQLTPIPVP